MARASRMHTIWWSSPAAWPRATSHHAAARSDAGVLAPSFGFHGGAVSSVASRSIQRRTRAAA